MSDDITRASMRDLLNNVLKENQMWIDYAGFVSDIYEANVENPIDQLANLRFISRNTDKNIVYETARQLGFDLTQDVIDMSQENLTRILHQLPMYSSYSHTVLFEKFIDFILNAITKVEYLYTQDYVNFYPSPGGTMIYEGGSWFKTTHINLDISLIEYEKMYISSGQTFADRTKALFYMFAPVALVIKTLFFTIEITDDQWLGGSAFGIGTYIPEEAGVVDILVD